MTILLWLSLDKANEIFNLREPFCTKQTLTTHISNSNQFSRKTIKTVSRILQQVSWIRRRDWHILSSGVFTYTNDERFQILHAEGSDDWTLQIKYVQKRDNGTYECQVSIFILKPILDLNLAYFTIGIYRLVHFLT